jgi:HAD superfamily hydrolase (TIGR01509 family)
VGAAKPDPRLFVEATARLGVDPGRTVHVGDGEGDLQGAEAAGLGFELVPLATVPDRLGVQ